MKENKSACDRKEQRNPEDLQVRKAQPEDLPELCDLYEKARQFMRSQGNLEQWNDGHPAWEDLSADIQAGQLYVICSPQGIEASFVFYIGTDPTYGRIEFGSWPNDKVYAPVHKVASLGRRAGMGKAILDWCKKQWPVLRMDTHADNHPMQHLLKREGFVHCGTIYLENGDPRLAYLYDPDADLLDNH